MKEIIVITVTAALSDNAVLARFFGAEQFLNVSKKPKNALFLGLISAFFMTIVTALSYPIYTYLLSPLNMQYLQTLTFVMIISLLVIAFELILRNFFKKSPLRKFMPMMTANTAILGVTLLSFSKDLTYLQAIFSALGSGVGYLLALLIFSSVRIRLESCDVPKAFKGLPITLIAAAIVAMSFFGFAGIADNLF